MGKIFKVIAVLLGLLVTLIVAAVIIIPLVVEPNDFRDEIVSEVKKATGRDLQIDGDLKLSVFPWLGLELGGLELKNASGFGDVPFASIKQAVVRVKLMPLLSKQIEVDRVTLDGLQLNLARMKDGRTNWDDLTAADNNQPPEQKEAQGEPEAMPLAGLAIGGVNISNANLSWRDDTTGQQVSIQQLNVEVGAITPGQPVALDIEFSLNNREPNLQAKIKLSANPLLDLDKGHLSIKKLVLTVAAKGEALAGKDVDLRLETGVDTDLAGQNIALSGLQFDAAGLSLSGDLKGRNLVTAPAFSGNFTLAEFNLRSLLSTHGLSVPETADAAVLTRVALAFDMAGTTEGVKLKKLDLVLDDSKLSGNITVNNLSAAMPAVGFDLNLNAIDLDRYLPPQTDGEVQPADNTTATTQDEDAQQNQGLLPVDMLRQLDINGVFTVGKLTVMKLQMEGIQLNVKAADGKINIGQQIKQFYQGSLQGKVDIDVSGKQPLLQLNEQLQGVQAGPLLKDATGEDRLTGLGRFNVDLKTRGNSEQALRQGLNGNLGFRFENGAIKGINVAQILRETWAKLNGKSVPPSSESKQTDFSELSGSALITNGVLNNEDLMAKSPFLRIDGAGQVDLVKEVLDYTLTTTIVSTMEGQGGGELTGLTGVPIPVRLTGSLADPKPSVDTEVLAKRLLQGKLGEQKEKLQQKAQEKIQEKLKGKLPGGLQDRLKGLL
ncbi:A/G-specific adenine glycosylase [hydrothermal vent metagenome]|uniref:A/G-specific adenine glycosylase n=1 Tax=hydrothermal vent metagenome TaxID=652676 RepID=A0A3B1C3Z2_9ZZZZ